MKRKSLNLAQAKVWVERCGNSLSAEHTIKRDELGALKRYLRTRRDKLPWLFVSERRTPFTDRGIYKIVVNAGMRAGLGKIHPHTLRHSCGYYLANKGWKLRRIQDYLGHRNPQHTIKYRR
jgi:type 1 fimbriae regulatory protein FimB